MRRNSLNIILRFLLLILVGLFIVYSFFNFDFRRIRLKKPHDKILQLDIYRDLAEEYASLNSDYSGQVVVFLGDSITKRFNIHEFSGNLHILNRGIFFDTTYGLLSRLQDNVSNLKIDKVFIMIGYNDLEYRDNDEILNNLKIITKSVKANKIYIQSLLPVSCLYEDKNSRIRYINSRIISDICNQDISYVDLYSSFVGNCGCIKDDLTRDGVHPNYNGYKLWYSIIQSIL